MGYPQTAGAEAPVGAGGEMHGLKPMPTMQIKDRISIRWCESNTTHRDEDAMNGVAVIC